MLRAFSKMPHWFKIDHEYIIVLVYYIGNFLLCVDKREKKIFPWKKETYVQLRPWHSYGSAVYKVILTKKVYAKHIKALLGWRMNLFAYG